MGLLSMPRDKLLTDDFNFEGKGRLSLPARIERERREDLPNMLMVISGTLLDAPMLFQPLYSLLGSGRTRGR